MHLATLFLATAGLVTAQSAPNSIGASQYLGDVTTGDGCVDPSGFQSCTNKVFAVVNDCSTSGTILEAECYCGLMEGLSACYLDSCWNKVYGCGYQYAVGQTLSNCYIKGSSLTNTSYPFFPAPDNAQGGCSCKIGDVGECQFGYQKQLDDEYCNQFISTPGASLGECICCLNTATASCSAGICPGYSQDKNTLANLLTQDQAFQCPSDLSQCSSQYNIANPPGGQFISIASLTASSGTLSPTNSAGQVTSLPSSVFTLAGGTSIVITATNIPVTAAASAAASASSVSSASASSGSSSTSTQTAGSKSSASTVGVRLLACISVTVAMYVAFS